MEVGKCLNCNSTYSQITDLDDHNDQHNSITTKLISSAFKSLFGLHDTNFENIKTLNICRICSSLLSKYCHAKQLFLKLTKQKSKISDLFQIESLCHDHLDENSTIYEDIKITPDLNTEVLIHDSTSLDVSNSTKPKSADIEYKELFPKLKVRKLKESTLTVLSKTIAFNQNAERASRGECTKCSRIFSELQELENHNNFCHLPVSFNFCCSFCPQKFTSTWFLKNHLNVCHDGMEILHNCKLCTQKFYSKEGLEEHNLKQHDIRKYPYKCKIKTCSESFKVIGELRSHLITTHEGSREADIAENNIKALEERKLKTSTCSICKEVFQGFNARLKHENSAHQYGTFNCTICQQEFKSKNELTRHQRNHKTCLICKKLFGTYHKMKVHHDRVHVVPVNRPYGCEMCGQKYSGYISLFNHYSWHVEVSGPKHCCNMCSKTYKLKGHLTLHVKEVHSKNYQKYKCPICFQIMSNKGNLNSHMNVKHKPDLKYPCKTCGKCFLNQQSASLHTRVHTQETMFSRVNNANVNPNQGIGGKVEVMSCFSSETHLFTCPSCGKTCASQTSFFRHLRTMHELKGFADPNIKVSSSVTCKMCDKTFSRQDLLDKHRRRVHSLTYKSSTAAVGTKSYHCSHCKKAIGNRSFQSFMAHVKRHEIFIVENVNDNPTVKKELAEFYDEKSRKFTCTFCKLISYNKQSKFLEHLARKSHSMMKTIYDYGKINDLELTYKCNECPGMAYPTEELLRRHKESHRFRKDRMKTCTICSANLRSPKYLKIHMQTHS